MAKNERANFRGGKMQNATEVFAFELFVCLFVRSLSNSHSLEHIAIYMRALKHTHTQTLTHIPYTVYTHIKRTNDMEGNLVLTCEKKVHDSFCPLYPNITIAEMIN